MNTKHERHAALWLLVFFACVGLGTGCGGYPEVSPKAYELAKLLDNACNVRQPSQLPAFIKRVNDAHAAGDISPEERDWLLKIADRAAEGEWDQAASEVRRLMLDQNHTAPVRSSHPTASS